MTQTFLVRKPVKVGLEYRQPGELCPEAVEWYRVDHLVHSGFLVRVERTDEEIAEALAKYAPDRELEIAGRDTSKDTPIDLTRRPQLGQPLHSEGILLSTVPDNHIHIHPANCRVCNPDQRPGNEALAADNEAEHVAAAEAAAQAAADAAAEGDVEGAVAAAQEAHKAAEADESGQAEAFAEIADEAVEEALAEEGFKLPRAELEKLSDEDLVELAKSAGLRVRARDKVIERLAED